MDPHKILVIHTAFIGDLILSTGFFRELRKGFPEAEIDLVTTSISAGLFKYNPHLNNIFPFYKKGLKGLINHIRLVGKLREKRYDTAFSLHLSLRSSLLMKQAGIPVRIGHHRMSLLTHPVTVRRNQHIKDRYIAILKPFVDFEPDSDTEIHLGEEDLVLAEKLISGKRGFKLGIAPGSARNTKRWPIEYFTELTTGLSDAVLIYYLGGPEDRELCQQIISKSGAEAVNLAGQTDLLGSAAVISKLDLLLTNDSAPLHMANAVKTDVLALLGPTVNDFGYNPYRENDRVLEVELDCRPCGKHGGRKCPQKHFRCMRDISPEMVKDQILDFVKRKA